VTAGGARRWRGAGGTPQHGRPRRQHPAAPATGQSPGRAGRPQVELRSSAGLRNPKRFLGGGDWAPQHVPLGAGTGGCGHPPGISIPPPSPSPGPGILSRGSPSHHFPGFPSIMSGCLMALGGDVGAATGSSHGGTEKIQIIVPEVLQREDSTGVTRD